MALSDAPSVATFDFSHSNPAFCDAISGNESVMGGERKSKPAVVPLRCKTLMGAAVSGLAAGAGCVVGAGRPWGATIPLIFIAILLAIASLFGMRAGILGTVIAALVFAAFLFAPLGSVRVSSDAARANLGWMLLVGLAFSLLFAPPTSGIHHH